MYRPRIFWIMAAAALLGCQGQRPAYDPFGRTTIPPPATGAVGAPAYAPPIMTAPPAVSVPNVPTAPQFAPSAAAPAPTPGPLNVTTPAMPASSPGLPAAPTTPPAGAPSGLQPVPRVNNPSPPWSGSANWTPHPGTSPVAFATAAPATHGPRLQPVSPFEMGIAAPTPSVATAAPTTAPAVRPIGAGFIAPTAAAQAAATPAPVAPIAAPQVVVIDNDSRGAPVVRIEDTLRVATLQPTPVAVPTPAASAPAPANWASGNAPKALVPVTAPQSVALASHESSILVPSGSSRSSVTPTVVTSPASSSQHEARYGHAPDYSRLNGKLEYSAKRKQWKLRYIPVDAAGQSDQYGGSVVLAGLGDMSQFHDGDFATVEGKIGERAGDAKDFAPDYQVRRIQK